MYIYISWKQGINYDTRFVFHFSPAETLVGPKNDGNAILIIHVVTCILWDVWIIDIFYSLWDL